LDEYDYNITMDNNLNKSHSFRLFKQMPSFWGGFASLINFSPSEKKYNYNPTPNGADIDSLRNDWRAVGEDLWQAIHDYERERKNIQTV
jgi:hypothetical protein